MMAERSLDQERVVDLPNAFLDVKEHTDVARSLLAELVRDTPKGDHRAGAFFEHAAHLFTSLQKTVHGWLDSSDPKLPSDSKLEEQQREIDRFARPLGVEDQSEFSLRMYRSVLRERGRGIPDSES